MTREKYQNRFRTLTNYKSISAIICYSAGILLLLNFEKLNTGYFFTCGIQSLLFIPILSTLVLKSLFNIRKLDIGKGSFRTNLLKYTKAKNNLLRLQQIAIGAGFLILFVFIPVRSKILSNNDIFQSEFKTTHATGLFVVLLLMAIFCRWGYRGHIKVTTSAESLLKDLE